MFLSKCKTFAQSISLVQFRRTLNPIPCFLAVLRLLSISSTSQFIKNSCCSKNKRVLAIRALSIRLLPQDCSIPALPDVARQPIRHSGVDCLHTLYPLTVAGARYRLYVCCL